MGVQVNIEAVGYPDTPQGRDNALRSVFRQCLERLEHKAGLGVEGWNSSEWIAESGVAALEHKFHVTAATGWRRRDLVDVINYCVFLVAAYDKGILVEDTLFDQDG